MVGGDSALLYFFFVLVKLNILILCWAIFCRFYYMPILGFIDRL